MENIVCRSATTKFSNGWWECAEYGIYFDMALLLEDYVLENYLVHFSALEFRPSIEISLAIREAA